MNAVIEQEIQAKGLIAPRVTPTDIEAAIAGEFYFTAAHGVIAALNAKETSVPPEQQTALRLLTFCVLVCHNGFTVTGESACASPENFDYALGRKIARMHAVDKLWPLLGYALRNNLAQQP